MDTSEREKEILHTVHYYREAIYIEALHRWYYDVYTVPDRKPEEGEKEKSQAYKLLTDILPNWRGVLHSANELSLPLPETLNLKRYSIN